MSIDDRDTQESKLFYFQLILLFTAAVQNPEQSVIFLGCALMGLKARFGRTAALVALAVHLLSLITYFPRFANHAYLEAILLAFLCWIDRSSEEQRELFFQSCR